MAVSKRLRYEILRRDNHACRYCGGIAPDVALTVDHVVPVALGGSDDPSNLVTACRDCNAGKSSAAAHPETVAEVADDAVRWAAAMQQAAMDAQADRARRAELHHQFAEVWDGYTFTGMKYTADIPDDWPDTIDRFIEAGLTIDDLCEFARNALNRSGVDRWNKYRYFCGIAWKVLSERQEAARELLSRPTSPQSDPHCTGEYKCYTHRDNGDLCKHCGWPNCLWQCGYDQGADMVLSGFGPTVLFGAGLAKALAEVVDGRAIREFEEAAA